MIGSTTPLDGEPGSQPLRPPRAYRPSERLNPAAIAAKRWDPTTRNPLPRIEADLSGARRDAFEIKLPRSLGARLKALASDNDELASFLVDLASAVRPEDGSGLSVSDSEAFAAGLPLEPKASSPVPQAHVQALVHDFRRRQRQAGMLVVGCVVTSFVLTLAGIAALASFAGRAPAGAEPPAKNSTSVVWQRPQSDNPPAKLILVSTNPNRAGKGEPLLIPARAAASDTASSPDAGLHGSGGSAPELIVMQAGRPLALAPLLSQHHARYVLLRGLPSEAKLSVGQRNPSGAWIVKDKDLGQLTLSIDGTAGGDYPVEIYALGAGSLPQGRQRLVFRVEPVRGQTAALDTNWAAPLRQMALTNAGQPEAAVTVDPSPLMARAMRLLGEGDIAAARLLFQHLADQGESEAAYELARTFDAQALNELGARGMGADRIRALNWYERASETGSSKAAERLKILASLSD
jgi:TPR repeat protein